MATMMNPLERISESRLLKKNTGANIKLKNKGKKPSKTKSEL